MDAQAEGACADGSQRNGCRKRVLVTNVGAINLRIPELCLGSYFPEDLLELQPIGDGALGARRCSRSLFQPDRLVPIGSIDHLVAFKE